MSVATQLLGHAANALALHHDDALLLQPANAACSGYAEELDMDPAERGGSRRRLPQLHIADEAFTHCLHIRRSRIPDDLNKADVNTIQDVKSGQAYRVLHFTDELTSPDVDFYCRLTS